MIHKTHKQIFANGEKISVATHSCMHFRFEFPIEGREWQWWLKQASYLYLYEWNVNIGNNYRIRFIVFGHFAFCAIVYSIELKEEEEVKYARRKVFRRQPLFC